jgi:RNA polymerase sigma-70 factor (ECF subfamily)
MTQTDSVQDDRELLTRAQAGDMSAFEALVSRHEDKVYGLALRMTRSEADAAEITQDTFLSAYQHLSEFRGEAAFGSWVHRIAANNALMRLRRQKVLDIVSDDLTGPSSPSGAASPSRPSRTGASAPTTRSSDDELGAPSRAATDALPEGYREVFLLKDVEGLSYEEISEMVGISIPAVKSRLHRARLALREAIDAFYKEV